MKQRMPIAADTAGAARIRKMTRRAFAGGLAASAGIGSMAGLLGHPTPALSHQQMSGGCSWPTSTTISASGTPNQIAGLPYGDGSYIQAKLALNVDSANGISLPDVFDGGLLVLGNDTIVTNLSNAYAQVSLSLGSSEGMVKSIAPRRATIISGLATVTKATAAETPSGGDPSAPLHLAFIRTSTRNLVNALGDSTIWRSYTSEGCWPDNVGPYPLWMSSRAEITGLGLSFDPWKASNQQTPSGKGAFKFDIHSNLWWLPAMSDAAVHHCHYANFMEVHTQLMGLGRMQKFTDSVVRSTCPDPAAFDMPVRMPTPESGYYGVPGPLSADLSFLGMYEEYRLAPADTNVPFAHVDDDGNFVYPWHQYYADTDCLWVVWEMVPTGSA